jgi:uncharacterized membrane protein YdjX (TVP38/TMEM64 family)
MNDRADSSRLTATSTPTSAGGVQIPKSLLMILAVIAVAVLGYVLRDELSLMRLAELESQFRGFQQQHPLLVYVVAFSAYVLVAGLSLPGATAMTLLMGWLFGFWRAVIVVSFASTLGATIAFLLSRYLLRDAFQNKFGDWLQKFNEALEREGAFYLFTLRLIPAVPFFVINVVMGLTRIPLVNVLVGQPARDAGRHVRLCLCRLVRS